MVTCDSKTFYMRSAIPYIGKETRANTNFPPTYCVLKWCEHLYWTNQNIIMDNWFSSSGLAEKLLAKGLTIVRTLWKNKSHIPPSFFNRRRLYHILILHSIKIKFYFDLHQKLNKLFCSYRHFIDVILLITNVKSLK